jgi:hypothetical protein
MDLRKGTLANFLIEGKFVLHLTEASLGTRQMSAGLVTTMYLFLAYYSSFKKVTL